MAHHATAEALPPVASMIVGSSLSIFGNGVRRRSGSRQSKRRATVDDAGVAGPIKGDDMANYLLAYKGGTMAETPEAQEAAMQAWMNWFGTLGAAVVDGGAPFGPSTAVQPDGSTGAASAGLSGYSVLQADSLEAAATLAKGCPVLEIGGTVEVYEALPM
jgi:hypothetical protein